MDREKQDLLDRYVLEHIDAEPSLLKQLNRDVHTNFLHPRMISGHLQGRILKMFCRILQPQFILELGTYTGYATLCLAEGQPMAQVHTIEVFDELEDFILKYFNQSPFKENIHLHVGDALQIIPRLDCMFDLVFIDANKRSYVDYYHAIFEKVRSGGVIIADNTLWDGKVLEQNPKKSDTQTIGIKEFNDLIAKDQRVEKVILPIRDGLTIIWKK